jgi:demethylmenaquinone methyltransferase / 2-methoxy-6-polyprenyl-1,4-benzoquinol methylase
MRDKSRNVREMFASIARRYDFLNHFLSGNVDKRWRRACVREVLKHIRTAAPAILDVGCGTADLALAFSAAGTVVGCDFCRPMLRVGREKILRHDAAQRVFLAEGDALALPFRDRQFDAVVSAFVLRNLVDVRAGLREMRRVLRPGGILGVLDFSMPRNRIFGRLYGFYFTCILPRLGAWISGVEGPYRYLPESVRTFPRPEELSLQIAQAGFAEVEFRAFSGGIAVLLLARAKQ